MASSRTAEKVAAGVGVQVDAELIGVVDVGGADGPGVEVDAAEVGDPGEVCGVIDDHEVGGAAAGEGDVGGLDAGGQVGGRALLEERLFGNAVDEALEDHRAVSDAAEGALGDGEVVADEVQLGITGGREVHLAGVGDRNLAAGSFDGYGAVRHGWQYSRAAGVQRVRMYSIMSTLSGAWPRAVRAAQTSPRWCAEWLKTCRTVGQSGRESRTGGLLR